VGEIDHFDGKLGLAVVGIGIVVVVVVAASTSTNTITIVAVDSIRIVPKGVQNGRRPAAANVGCWTDPVPLGLWWPQSRGTSHRQCVFNGDSNCFIDVLFASIGTETISRYDTISFGVRVVFVVPVGI